MTDTYKTITIPLAEPWNAYEEYGILWWIIGVGRFRILGGGQRFRILRGGREGGPNSQQAHDVVMTSMRRNDVASKSFRRHVPNRFLINQCQIMTFLILKYDIIENSRIELRGIVLPVQVGGLLAKGYVAPPLSNYWGAWPPCPPPPLPTPMGIHIQLHWSNPSIRFNTHPLVYLYIHLFIHLTQICFITL